MTRTDILKQLFVMFLVLIFNPAYAIDCKPWVAKAISIQGDVERRSSTAQSTLQWLPIKRNDELCAGEMVRVKQNSRAALILKNDTILRLNQNTTITLSGLIDEQSHWIDIEQGIAHFIARIKQSFKVITPFVNAAVKGTEFVVSVNQTQSEVTVFEGLVSANNALGRVKLKQGQTAIATQNSAPSLQIKLKPRDAVQWSLYYPAIISIDPEIYKELDDETKNKIKHSIEAVRVGKINTAITLIESIPDNNKNPKSLTYRAGLYLSVGQIDKANSDIQESLKLKPDNSQAIALQAIIALVQNDKTKALTLAEQANSISPDSPSSALVLSYVHQSLFDINRALDVIKVAVEKNKNNAQLWSRLSELYLMVGKLKKALEAATHANDLNSDIARTYSTLGFAYLSMIKVKKAEQAFKNAIERDDTDPLSRLGLGLAIIRQGNLKEGRREIEFATTLDPNNALIRSYLGKAYYEETRDKLAEVQYEMAKQLDPKDPTAYYYSAIKKQNNNNPIGALNDIIESIKLNNNKAIYRSTLLLDQDLASQNVSISNIYQNLGYEEKALKYANNSLSSDPGNYSAHRLLADLYLSKPRHEIARVSELLQAKTLNPLNTTPTQPQLSEGNLTLFNNLGRNNTKLNEYDSLFSRNKIRLNLNGLVAGNNTEGTEAILSGTYNWLSFSASDYHYKTDGFHINNGLHQDLTDFFIQAEISNSVSLFLNKINTKVERGDFYRFYSDNFNSTLNISDEDDRNRIGLRLKLSPSDVMIWSHLTSDRTMEDSKSFGSFGNITDVNNDNSKIIETSYLHNSKKVDIIFGLSNTDVTNELRRKLGTISFAPKVRKIEDFGVYFYSTWNFNSTIDLTLGVSKEKYKNPNFNLSEINPKIGLLWNVNNHLSFRAAYLSTLRRTMYADATLEKTTVSTFNQFYNDEIGTIADQSSLGLDYVISKNLTLGFEHIDRDLEVPYLILGIPTSRSQLDRTTNLFMNWTLNNYISLNTNLQRERIDRGDFIGNQTFENILTYKLPIGLNIFMGQKFKINITLSYIAQEGSFIDINDASSLPGKDSFWIADALVSYNLPNKIGSIIFGVKNLFNENIQYEETDKKNPTISPERIGYLHLNLFF